MEDRPDGHPDELRNRDALVFTPTYNERDSIEALLDGVLGLPGKYDLLIVDDSSTDGTQAILQARAVIEPRLHIITRPGKRGIDTAHKLAWMFARSRGYRRIVTMDADLSHDPDDIPRLLAALDAGADVAVGSRFAPGGRLDYHGWRRLLSVTANHLARRLLGLKINEYTTSFRAARLDRVPTGLVEGVAAQGYSFFLACIVALGRAGMVMREVPIHFHDRTGGESKMPRGAVRRGVISLLHHTIDRSPPDISTFPAPEHRRCPACGEPFRLRLPDGAKACFSCFAA